jgi:hypothetical protein
MLRLKGFGAGLWSQWLFCASAGEVDFRSVGLDKLQKGVDPGSRQCHFSLFHFSSTGG